MNYNQSFSEFSQTEAMNLKKLASFFFQDEIHFHPGHLHAAQDTYIHSQSTCRIILNKTGPFFWVFTDVNTYFGFVK